MSDTGFVVFGADHPHAIILTAALVDAGATPLAWVDPSGSGGAMGFGDLFPQIPLAGPDDALALLGRDAAQLAVVAAIPRDRAALAEQAMEAGADVLVAKPGAIDRDQLSRIERTSTTTGRRWWVAFTEYLTSPAMLVADDLIAEGRIGQVRHVLGLGPHRLGTGRPDWFHDPAAAGPMIADLASHQIHHAVRLLGTRDLTVATARTTPAPDGRHPEQLAELLLEGGTGSAYIRVDWLTPDGLPTWGDVRLMITGDRGTIEVRSNCDIGGADGTDHLLVVDTDGVHRIDVGNQPTSWATEILRAVEHGTEPRITTADSLAVSALALEAAAIAAA